MSTRASRLLSRYARLLDARAVAILGLALAASCSSMGADEESGDDDDARGAADYTPTGMGGGAAARDTESEGAAMGGTAQTTGGPVITYAGGTGIGGTVDAGPPPPPEEEVESSFRAPVATGSYVWTANPTSGAVALIDVSSPALEIETLEAGNAPTYLVAVSNPEDPEDNAALVLNVLSHDATLLRVGAEPVTFSTHQGANSLEVSRSGDWAVAWTDARVVEDPDPLDTFQEVTVIPLQGGDEKRLSVGMRPISVAFDAPETRAFVVTEEGITDIDLSGPSVAGHFDVTDDPLDDPALRDVTITPDGAWALVRVDGSNTIGIYSLQDGDRMPFPPLPDAVSDLDLSEDGTLAVAVLAPPLGQTYSGYYLLPMDSAADPPLVAHQISARFGSVSVSDDGSIALLYTTVYDQFGDAAERVTILQTTADPGSNYRIEDVRAPVRAVFPAPDARHAIVLQEPPLGSTRAGAFSIVPIAADIRPTLVATDARPQAVAMTPDGHHALVTVRDDTTGVFGVHLVQLETRRQDYIELASAPLATGIVAAENKGYVAQEHPEGRITIIDFGEPGGSPRTVTGFELGSRTER